MDADQARAFLLKLPYVVETLQWGDNLVFWVGDKTIGGKMFVLVDLGVKGGPVIAYAAGPKRYATLLEIDGIIPAPYLARAWWVAAVAWNVFRKLEWESELRAAHTIIYAKLPVRTRKLLESTASKR